MARFFNRNHSTLLAILFGQSFQPYHNRGLLGEQPLVPIVSSLLLGRGLLRRRWSDLVFDLLVRVSVVVVELRRIHHELPPGVPVLRDVNPVLAARLASLR
jgi:hypothetical protein